MHSTLSYYSPQKLPLYLASKYIPYICAAVTFSKWQHKQIYIKLLALPQTFCMTHVVHEHIPPSLFINQTYFSYFTGWERMHNYASSTTQFTCYSEEVRLISMLSRNTKKPNNLFSLFPCFSPLFFVSLSSLAML